MTIVMRSFVIVLFTLLCVPLFFLSAQQQPSPNPAPQIYQGRLGITVTGFEKVQKWDMFHSGYELKPTDNEDLIVMKFKIKNIQTGEEDVGEKHVNLDIEELKDFELEDTQGNKYPSPVINTNYREVPFTIPKGTKLKFFRIVGLTFDIQSLAKSLDKK